MKCFFCKFRICVRDLRTLLLLIIFFVWQLADSMVKAQVSMDEVPMIGAELFIEKGQKPEEIDTWVKRMKESGMSITRIRMFEDYMRKADGSWDFSLYDEAFRAAEKYGIKVYANLYPATNFAELGGFKYPRDEAHLNSISEYIKNLVTHFKKFKSLYGWVPVNEPGIGGIPKGDFAQNKYNEWLKKQPASTNNSKGYEHFDFADNRFLLYYNTWFLNWLADEIRKFDPKNPIHVNTHAIFENVAIYDFPGWSKFLTSLGGSAHASWHFGYFTRKQYGVAMSANSEIIRSGAIGIPWLMTEMQGGNNTYSGGTPMCPTKEEIAQWTWTVIGTESKGAIFWCLNPRSSGIEAGEWALLNFQDEPSDRMQSVANVAGVINSNPELFAKARVAESGVSVLYSREALWVERKLQNGISSPYQGRNPGGAMKSALAYFEALSEMGIQANLKELGEFDFSKSNFTGKTIILAQQIAIHSKYWQNLSDFVSKGGKLIVDGMTAYFDENALCIMKTGFPFENVFGGNIKEYKLIDDKFLVRLDDPDIKLPAHMWMGTIKPTTGKPIGSAYSETTGLRNTYGKGEVCWIPTLIGLGARNEADYSALSVLLKNEISGMDNISFRFKQHQPGMLMKTLKTSSDYITIIINKSAEERDVELVKGVKAGNPAVLFANKGGNAQDNSITIFPEETLVIKWKVE